MKKYKKPSDNVKKIDLYIDNIEVNYTIEKKINFDLDIYIELENKKTYTKVIILSEVDYYKNFIILDNLYVSAPLYIPYSLVDQTKYFESLSKKFMLNLKKFISSENSDLFSTKDYSQEELDFINQKIESKIIAFFESYFKNLKIHNVDPEEYNLEDLEHSHAISDGDDLIITLNVKKILPDFILWAIFSLLIFCILMIIISLSVGKRGGISSGLDLDFD